MAGLVLAALLGLHAASHWLVHDWLFPGSADAVVYGPPPPVRPPATPPARRSAPTLAASGADAAGAYGPGM